MPLRRRLTRSLVAGLLILVAGCGGRSAATSADAIVAQAAGANLDRQTLERWLMASPEIPSGTLTNRIIATWIDETLFATALQRGPAIDDSATADAVIAPDAARGELVAFMDALRAARPAPSEAQVDSLADLDLVRVFQQIVLVPPNNADSAAIRQVLVRLGALLRRALAPAADFAALAREASEDSASRARGGFLPAVTRGALDTLMPGNRLWTLAPGAVSTRAIRTNLGFHMFRRATPAEARPYLKAWLAPELARIADSRFADSVTGARNVVLTPGALRRFRGIAREPIIAADGTPLVTWSGGALSPADVRTALILMSPDQRLLLNDASDSLAENSLRTMARNRILAALAVPGGGVTPGARAALVPQYLAALDTLRMQFRQADGTTAAGAEAATALLDKAVASRQALRVFPGVLAGVLRSRYPVRIDTVVVADLVPQARQRWQLAHAADATAADTTPAAGAPRRTPP